MKRYELAAGDPPDTRIPDQIAKTRFENVYPKILTELRRNLKKDLRDILENIYLYVACAVHSRGITTKKRNKLLQSFGFKTTGTDRLNGKMVDLNDMSIMAVFLVFKESSEHPFWESIRPQKGHAWFAYLVSGIWAGAASVVVIFLLHFLTPKKLPYSVTESLARTIPWGLVPLFIAFIISYHLDRDTSEGKRTAIVEALTTMGGGMLAAVLATLINAGIIQWSELLPTMKFTVTAAALLVGKPPLGRHPSYH